MKLFDHCWQPYCNHPHLHHFLQGLSRTDNKDLNKCVEEGCSFSTEDIGRMVHKTEIALAAWHNTHEYDKQCWLCIKENYN